MMTAVLSDFVTQENKGKLSGILGLFSGSGALLALFVFLRLPAYFDNEINGLKITYWIVAGISFLFAIFIGLVLRKPRQSIHLDNTPVSSPASRNRPLSLDRCPVIVKSKNFPQIVYQGIIAIKNPRVLVSYFGSFLARGDTVIITLFLPLWIYSYYISSGSCASPAPNDPDINKSCREAYLKASTLSGVAQTAALLFAPLFGYISDKFYRPISMFIAAFIGAVGYFWLFFSQSPIGFTPFVIVSLIGIGEIGMVVCSLGFVTGDHIPIESRGSISGVYSMFGALGILFNTKLGGYLFDTWNPGAPFFLMGIAHVFVVVLVLIVVVVDYLEKQKGFDFVDREDGQNQSSSENSDF